VLNQIQAIGANMISAEYSNAGVRMGTFDPLTVDDVRVVREQVPVLLLLLLFLPSTTASGLATASNRTFLCWAHSLSTNRP